MIHLACDPKYFLIKNFTNGHAGNEKLMLDIDNIKYKKCFFTSRDIFDLLSEKTNHSHSQLQKTAFSLPGQERACSRITWLFVRSRLVVTMPRRPNTQENDC